MAFAMAGTWLATGDEAGTRTIRWLPETLVLVQKAAVYGRIIRLRDSRLLCVYSRGKRVYLRTSRDDGRSWAPEERIIDYPPGIATNAEAVQLRDGTVLVAANGRPTNRTHPYIIVCIRSTDGGATWSAPTVAYEAGTTFGTGCWEPAFLELPDGNVQLYFANEAPFPDSREQEIAMLSSADGGLSWSAPRQVLFRAGHRDGMPVPLLLADGRTLVVAIEDDGLNGAFKPALCRTSLDALWANAPVGGDSPDRLDPLATPLPRGVYAGAPYLCRLGASHTVLSFQRRDKPMRERGDWSTTYATVCVGDADARHFGPLSCPFAAEGNPGSVWNGLFAKSDDTVILVSSATIRGTAGLWAIGGRLAPAAE